MRAYFLGKDPQSRDGDSPTLYATDRTDLPRPGLEGDRLMDERLVVVETYSAELNLTQPLEIAH